VVIGVVFVGGGDMGFVGEGDEEKGGREMKIANKWHKQSKRVEVTEMGLSMRDGIE
jgi:hypothetical protein